MFIDTVPNRKSPPAILLRESYRECGKVKKRTLANLSKLPQALIEGIRSLRRRRKSPRITASRSSALYRTATWRRCAA